MINEPINPVAISNHSLDVNAKFDFSKSYPEAANIVGIARRNENSTAVSLLAPKNIAPKIVEADLDTPGTIDND